jgi:hypothetical protein
MEWNTDAAGASAQEEGEGVASGATVAIYGRLRCL